MRITQSRSRERIEMKNITYTALLLLYMNLIPYACRLYRGMDWAAQYLPDEGHRFFGLLFFGGFASLPALPLIVTFWLRKHLPVTFIVSLIASTGLLVFWHHGYDLASDAQAAIGLVFIPVYTLLLTMLTASVAAVIELLSKKFRWGTHTMPEDKA